MRILFESNGAFAASDGSRIEVGGREARFKPGGFTSNGCVVKVRHRPYVGAGDSASDEVLVVDVGGRPPPDRHCSTATELATAVVATLPPA